MTPKPLSKERREEIESNAKTALRYVMRADVIDLLAAEQYWREAVKNLKDPLE